MSTGNVCAAPCVKCPWLAKFKSDDDYLRPGRRAGIVEDMLRGNGFPCHATVDYTGDDVDEYDVAIPDVSESMECAGAALVMLRADRPPQVLRIMERLGMFDSDEFLARHADVELWTMREALDELHTGGQETEGTCNVVNAGCLAPAGYMIGGEAVHGTDMVDTCCPQCGEFVCEECSDDDGNCLNDQCSDERSDDDYE